MPVERGRVFSRGFTLLLVAVSSGAGSLAALSTVLEGPSRGLLVLDLASSLVLLAVAVKAWSLGVLGAYWIPLSLPPTALSAEGLLPGDALVWLWALGRAALAATAAVRIPRYSTFSLGADSTLIQLAVTAGVAVLLGAAGVYAVEGGRGPIKTFWDALWWAMATATTVGYGDVVPVTPAGRAVAVGLMILGIGTLGLFLSDMAARMAKALSQEEAGEGLPVLEREKRMIARAILDLEELSEEEVEVLINKIRVLHVLLTATPEERRVAAKGMAAGAAVVKQAASQSSGAP